MTEHEMIMYKAIKELRYQYEMCVDQTGMAPGMDDYMEYIESEEWKDKIGSVRLGSILNFLISRY